MKALFAGLTTVDIFHYVDCYPASNSKTIAKKQMMLAGGPAANAAVAYQVLGGEAKLVSKIGAHPLASIAYDDLIKHNIRLVDLAKNSIAPPAVSSIIISQDSGDRSVVYKGLEDGGKPRSDDLDLLLDEVSLVMVDGHMLQESVILAQEAKKRGLKVVFDGGSWKHGLEELLPFVDTAVCSGQFYSSQNKSLDETAEFLENRGVREIAFTRNAEPIVTYLQGEKYCIKVPQVNSVDTLGSGDILHGALCYYILQKGFIDSLKEASKIASLSCAFYGTREWIDFWRKQKGQE